MRGKFRFLFRSDSNAKLKTWLVEQKNHKEFIKDIFRVEASFAAWGEEFTSDCTKKERGTHQKWLKRKIQHVNRVAIKTGDRLGC